MWFSWGKGKHGVRFTEGTSQRTQVTIEESSWDICVQLQAEVSANITRQATEDKTNGLPNIRYGVLVTRGASDCA